MFEDVEELLAESIVLRRSIVSASASHIPQDPAALDRSLASELAAIQQVLSAGGRVAVVRAGLCGTSADEAFVLSGFDAWEADRAVVRSAEGAALAATRLAADCLLARRYLLDPISAAVEARRGFIAEARQGKPGLIRRLREVEQGRARPDSLGPFWTAAQPCPERYLARSQRAAPTRAPERVGQAWDAVVERGLLADRGTAVPFGATARSPGHPLVLRGDVPAGAELRITIDGDAGDEPVRLLLAVSGEPGARLEADSWNDELEASDGRVTSRLALEAPWSGVVRVSGRDGALVCQVASLTPGRSFAVRTGVVRDGEALAWVAKAPPRLRGWLAEQAVAVGEIARGRAERRLQRARAAFGRLSRAPWTLTEPQLRAALADPDPLTAEQRQALVSTALSAFAAGGAEAVPAHLARRTADMRDLAGALQDVAEAIGPGDPEAAAKLFWMAYGADPSPARGQSLAGKLYKAGDLSSTAALLNYRDPKATRYKGEMRLSVDLWSRGPQIPSRRQPGTTGAGVAYVASSALPFQATGYTVRTQQLLAALNAAGLPATGLLRPGYPHDRPESVQTWPEGAKTAGALDYHMGGVPYRTTPLAGVETLSEGYLERAADALLAQFEALRPAVVQAASNYRNALPALMAARRFGAPFVYEVRGLWEITAASRSPGWEATERYQLDRAAEVHVAAEADLVLAITQGVAAELTAGGVSPEKIALLPNAVDPQLFRPTPRDAALAAALGLDDAFTLVYAGTLTVYEGLDDLIAAVGLLRGQGIRSRLILVGDGPYRAHLEAVIVELNLQDAVTFVGRTSPDEVGRHLSLADAVALPRKPFEVCKVVSPLKPFEAMAMALPVVLSDLPALREIVTDDVTGLLAAPADPAHLARTLRRLALNVDLRHRLGQAARRWVEDHRSWAANAGQLKVLYAERLGLDFAVTNVA